MTPNPRPPQAMVAWMIWASILVALTVIHFKLYSPEPGPLAEGAIRFVVLVPLFISVVVRFTLLPRLGDWKKALPVFVLGIALAEACGLIGTFLVGGTDGRVLYFSSAGVILLYLPSFLPALTRP